MIYYQLRERQRLGVTSGCWYNVLRALKVSGIRAKRDKSRDRERDGSAIPEGTISEKSWELAYLENYICLEKKLVSIFNQA